MGKNGKKFVIVMILTMISLFPLVLKPELCYSQEWHTVVDDTRLTSAIGNSWHSRLEVDSNGNIHVAWQDNRDFNDEIYYTKLDNNGNTLVDDTRLTFNIAESGWPDLELDGSGSIHIIWRDSRNSNPEIYYTKLDNNGNVLVDSTRLTYGSSNSYGYDFRADRFDHLHLAWVDYRDGNPEIYFAKLDSIGNHLVNDTRLTSAIGDSWWPNLCVDNSDNIHIAWYDARNGNGEIYYKKIDNNGNTLVNDIRLTFDGSAAGSPTLEVDNSDSIHIIWADNRDGDNGLYYTKLDNIGNTIIEDTLLTYSRFSAGGGGYWMVIDNNNVHIIFGDNRDGNDEIYYTNLDNNGNTLVNDTRLTFDGANSWWPRICVDGTSSIHTIWDDDRDGNREIYYTKGSIITLFQQDSLALVALYDSTNGAGWTNSSNWLTGNVSTWYGITVSGGRVTEISFDHNGLSGPIPTSIGDLDGLQVLNLPDNQLTGTIPTEIGNLNNLTWLELFSNQLSGTIPAEIGNLDSLQYLDLGNNQLSGSITAEIGSLTNLTYLSFYNNQLSGSIPSEIGNLINLTSLNFWKNQLSGSIPQEIGNLVNLTYLDFDKNQLSGEIPSEIGNLTNLINLWLGGNQLTGSFPSWTVNLTNLTGLGLYENQLFGSVPSEIDSLANLIYLWIHNNQFSGSIPTEISNLNNMKYCSIHSNQFSRLPDLTPVDSLKILRIQNNRFTFEDIEPNINAASDSFFYSPQESVGVAKDTIIYVGSSFTLSVSTGGANSLYQWKKGVGNIGGLSSDSTYTIYPVDFSDAGIYTCEITNTVADLLTLYSRSVNVSVQYSPFQQDSLALVALYDSTNGAGWTTNSNWLTGNLSTWYGVTVSGGRVYEVNLSSNNLIGTIPAEIGNLSNLFALYLNNNQLSGSIPPEIGNLDSLRYLQLPTNQLSGSIPPEIGNLDSLIYLGLSSNQLSGPIPSELWNLTNLTNLVLGDNQLSGTIPPGIGNLSNLWILYLYSNQLGGPVPAEIVSLNNMEYFYIHENQFNGLPDLSSIDSLNYLKVQDNKLTFEDIEPNINAAEIEFTYSPQDSIGIEEDRIVSVGSDLTITLPTSSANNNYNWKKDDVSISGSFTDNIFIIDPIQTSDAGSYTCEITNTIASDLTLYSRPIHVRVYPDQIPVSHNFPFIFHENISNYSPQDYRLVGIPGNSNLPLEDVLEGQAGTDWQAYLDNGSASNNPDDYLVEYYSGNEFRFQTGRAFWLINKGNWDFGRPSVPTHPLNNFGEVEILLPNNGWNLITNPFEFVVDWQDVRDASNITGGIWSYDGTFHTSEDFNPYEGYYYYNENNLPNLAIPYKPKSGMGKPESDERILWKVNVTLKSEKYSDDCNMIGVAEDADCGIDKLDKRKPHTVGRTASINIQNIQPDGDYIILARDYRPDITEFEMWNLQVNTPGKKEATLFFNMIEDIPEDLEIFLVDLSTAKFHDLREVEEYRIKPARNNSDFRVIIGKPKFVKEQMDNFLPTVYELSQNYPNPFNPETIIPVTLKEDSYISLNIYDILGRKVKTLFQGEKNRGIHHFQWNGTNQTGNRLASGVYIYRLDIKNETSFFKKMIMLK